MSQTCATCEEPYFYFFEKRKYCINCDAEVQE